MKKYLLHPDRIFYTIILLIITIPIIIVMSIGFIKEDKNGLGFKEWGVFILSFLMAFSSLGYGIYYLIKHGGTITYDSEYVIIKKHFKTIKFKISDIRWIKFDMDPERCYARLIKGLHEEFWECTIRLIDQKKELPITITNKIILNLICEHNIRVMPHEEKEYIYEEIIKKQIKKKKNK